MCIYLNDLYPTNLYRGLRVKGQGQHDPYPKFHLESQDQRSRSSMINNFNVLITKVLVKKTVLLYDFRFRD